MIGLLTSHWQFANHDKRKFRTYFQYFVDSVAGGPVRDDGTASQTSLTEVKLRLRRRLKSVWHKTRVTFCSSIVACPAGTFFHQESSSCTACSKGTYQDKEGQSSCKPCSDGETTDKKGAESANDCEPSKNR